MKNSKFIICFLSVMILAMCMFGCANSDTNKDVTEPETTVAGLTEESKTETENVTEIDTQAENSDEVSESQSVAAPEPEDGELEIMTIAPQPETEKADSAQEHTQASSQQETSVPADETQSQEETYIVLPFVPAE